MFFTVATCKLSNKTVSIFLLIYFTGELLMFSNSLHLVTTILLN